MLGTDVLEITFSSEFIRIRISVAVIRIIFQAGGVCYRDSSDDETSNGVGVTAALEARIAESERIAELHKEELQKHHQSFHPVSNFT